MTTTATRTTGNAPTSGIDRDSEDYQELSKTWKEVEIRVQLLAETQTLSQGGQVASFQRNLDIDGVLKIVQKTTEYKKKDAANYARVEKAINMTLDCIDNIGGIIADGVSPVFAPAQTCYNALTFVIQAWKGYVGIFENLAGLLERCVEFLERLDQYKAYMDVKLMRVAVQHLQLFVSICDRSIQLSKKHAMFKAFVKMLFLKDDDVRSYLGAMDKLVDKERGLVVAQIFKFVNEHNADLKVLVEDKKEQKKESDAKNWRSTIAKTLGFEPGDLDPDSEPVAKWRTTLNKYKNLLSLLEDTGRWILDDADGTFMQWAKGASNLQVPPILVLNGERGSGKTFMMANVIKYLGSMEGIASKAVLSYVFVQPDLKQAGPRDGSSILEHVSRSLLWQCAVGSETMTRSIGQTCGKVQDLTGAVNMWKRLFLDNAERQKTETVFYLFLDGLDDNMPLLVPLLRLFSADTAERRVRVFLTTTPTSQEQLAWNSISFRSIDIHNNNNSDITSYIGYRMDQMDILKDTTRSGISVWRRDIEQKLQEKCDGDYFKLVTNLDAIAKVDLVDDIEDVLENADKTRADQIAAEIERLNRVRTPKERMEINEIIRWIHGGETWLSVEAMEAVLAVRHLDGLARPQTSLLPFDIKIKTKYSIFQVDFSGFVKFRSDEIAAGIPVYTTAADADTRRQVSVVPASHRISDGEMDIVQHFLATVCPPGLYQRFGFDTFLEQKRILPLLNTDICSDPDNTHIRIVLSSLKVLTSPKNERTAAIRHYARMHLLSHLRKTDLAKADRELKAAVGPLLVALFTRDVGIDALFWIERDTVSQQSWETEENRFLRLVRVDWLYSFDGVDRLLDWLSDADVVREIVPDTEDDAFVAAFTKQGANRHEVLFTPAAMRVATKLLRFDHFSLREGYTWLFFLNGFIDKLPRQGQTSAQLEAGGQDEVLVGTEDHGTVPPLIGNDHGNDDLPEIPRSADAIRKLDIVTFSQIEKRIVSLAQMMRIEEWALAALSKGEVVHDSLWEVQMAAMISDCCNHLKAEEIADQRAHKALEMDPNHWLVCYYLSLTEAEDEASIKLSLRSIQSIDNIIASSEGADWLETVDHQISLAQIHLRVGHRYWRAGQLEKSVEHHRKSFKFSRTRFCEYMEALSLYNGAKHWGDVMALLDLMLESVDEWPPYFDELYTDLISNPHFGDVVLSAANALNSWDAVESLFEHATRIAGQGKDWDSLFVMFKWLGDMLYKHDANLERHETGVVASWAAAIEVSVDHPSNGITMGSVTEVARNLSRIYLEQALRYLRKGGGIGTADKVTEAAATQLLAKITALAFPDVAPMWQRTVLCCIARYHVQVGNMVEAKRAVAGLMEAIMAFLSDNDPSNDEWAMMCLREVVTAFADERNTIAAWQIENLVQAETVAARRAWEERVQEGSGGSAAGVDADGKDAESSTEKDTDGGADASAESTEEHGAKVTGPGATEKDASSLGAGSISIPAAPVSLLTCGGCHKESVYASQTYMCCDCVGLVSFDEKCYQLLQKGELRKFTPSVCNQAHHFVYLPKWDDGGAKAVPKGSLPMRSGTITLEDWKKELRAKYMDLGS